MSEPKSRKASSISKGESLDQIAEFWDTHSLADHWDKTRKVLFDVKALRRRRVTIDPDLYKQVARQARTRGSSPETLVNLLLSRQLQQVK